MIHEDEHEDDNNPIKSNANTLRPVMILAKIDRFLVGAASSREKLCDSYHRIIAAGSRSHKQTRITYYN